MVSCSNLVLSCCAGASGTLEFPAGSVVVVAVLFSLGAGVAFVGVFVVSVPGVLVVFVEFIGSEVGVEVVGCCVAAVVGVVSIVVAVSVVGGGYGYGGTNDKTALRSTGSIK